MVHVGPVKPGLLRLALCAGPALAGTLLAAASRPNILLILTDDQGWSQNGERMDPRVASSKSEYLETPHLARLMREGMRFTSGYSPAPLCTPTRRSIQAGTTTARSGTEFPSPRWIPAAHLTIPRALKAVDPAYRCAHFGKWGEQMNSTPEECGYDASDGLTGNNTGGMPSTLAGTGSHEAGPAHFIDNEDPKRTTTLTNRAIAFMTEQARSGKPFYVQASYYAQHLSVVCTEKMLAKYAAKGPPDRGYTQAWAAMMEELDHGIGRLLQSLDDLGIAGNTFVFFTADNGGRGTVPGGDTSRLPPNHPLSGAKHHLYEGGIRVPFIVRGPRIAPGVVSHTPVAGYDFLPTFQALAGGQRAALSAEVDGVSLVPVLQNPAARLVRPAGALIFHRPGRLMSALRQDNYKLMVFWQPDGAVKSRELYDLAADPREIPERNLADQDPRRTDALFAQLSEHLRQVGAERPQPPASKAKGKGKARKK